MCSKILHILLVLLVFACFSVATNTALDSNSIIAMEKFSTTTTTFRGRRDISGDVFEPITKTPRMKKREVGRMQVDGVEIVFRIVNGLNVSRGQIPYQVSIRKKMQQSKFFANFCGGAIIAPKEIISAAHCFRRTNVCDHVCSHSDRADESAIKGVWVVAGVLNAMSHFHGAKDTKRYGEWRSIRSVHLPKKFAFPKNDIAIVFLNNEFKWSDLVKPIPYASKFKEYKGDCLASGYGRLATSKTAKRSTHLLMAYLLMLPSKVCSQLHHKNMHDFICTSDVISDTAVGDSGGPLVCMNTGDPKETSNATYGILVGVTSGGSRQKRNATIFTRVSAYKKWIKDTLEKDATHPKLFKMCLILIYLLHWCFL